MKKSILLTTLLVGGLLLASCDIESYSEPSSEESTTSEVSEPESEGESGGETGSESGSERIYLGSWSESEQALIDQYLSGVNMPAVRIEGNSELFYDSDYDLLSITGATVTSDDLATVVSYFESYGWTATNADTYSDDGYYEVTTTVVDADNVSHEIFANIYALDSDSYYATEGTYWLDVSDPYVYSWPSEDIASAMSSLGTTYTLPAYEADYYQYAYLESWELGYIYCYTSNTDATSEYKAILEAAGFTVDSESASDGYYDAYTPDELVYINFGYDESYGDLDIYFTSI